MRAAVMLLSIVLLWSNAAMAQDSLTYTPAGTDTPALHIRKKHDFNPKSLILPAGIFAVGAFGLAQKSPVRILSENIHDRVKDGQVRHVGVDDYLQYSPLALNICLSACGVKTRHGFRDRFLITGGAYVCTIALTNGMKYTIREKRPDSGARNSFPSGHTSFVFTGAELVRMEFGPYYGLAAYCAATCVGVLRITNDRHWFHDVVAGAGIGIFSARMGYWLLPVWRHVFPFMYTKKERAMMCMPSFDPTTKSVALGCSIML